MQRSFRWIGLTGLVLTAVRALGAQQLVPFGAAEAGGRGSSLFLLGLSASGKGAGWQPVAQIEGYHLTFRTRTGTGASAVTSSVSNDVIEPSVGLKYGTSESATQFRVGYAFVNSSSSTVGVVP